MLGLWWILLSSAGVCLLMTAVHNLRKHPERSGRMQRLARALSSWSTAGAAGGGAHGSDAGGGDSTAGESVSGWRGSMAGWVGKGWVGPDKRAGQPSSSAQPAGSAAAAGQGPSAQQGVPGRTGSIDLSAYWGPLTPSSKPALAQMYASGSNAAAQPQTRCVT